MRTILTERPPLFRENVTSPQQLQSNDVVFIHKMCADNQSDVTLNNRWYIGVITNSSFSSLYIENKSRAVVECNINLLSKHEYVETNYRWNADLKDDF